MADQLSVRIIRCVAEVEEIREAWSSWNRHPNSDVDHYLHVLASTPEILRPYVIVLNRYTRPEAMLIGRLEVRQMALNVGYASLLKPKARALTFIYGGLLGNASPEGAKILVREIENSLRNGEADIAYLNHLRVNSALCDCVRRLPGFLSRDHFPTLQIHRSLILPDSVEQFYASLSAKVRKNQKRQAKKLLGEFPGNVRTKCFREMAEIELMVRDVAEIAKTTYQQGLGVGFVDSLELRRRLRLQVEKGWLRAYVLYIAERPCAFWMGTLYKHTFHSDFMGYDPRYGKYSPGMFLIMKVIEGFCSHQGEDDIGEIDFGLGDAQYKEVLADREWPDAAVYVFAPTLKGFWLNFLRTPGILIDRFARKFLERTGLLAKIKSAWRTRIQRRERLRFDQEANVIVTAKSRR